MRKGIIFAVFLVLGVLASGCIIPGISKESACTNSGGIVATGMCCLQTGDFPDLCLIGACGCSPDNSHEVKVCECGEGMCFDGNRCALLVDSFYECVRAGYPVLESLPRQCNGPDGREFTEGEESCTEPAGEIMTLFEAKQIAVESECGDQLKEPYYEFSVCNQDTGTWWIDLDVEKEGCNPACVVVITNKKATINWRCTGLVS